MPIRYDTVKNAFRVYGTFCSFACMNGYLRDNRHSIPGSSGCSIGMSIFDFFKKYTGIQDPRKLVKAPPRCLLRAFGGYMSITEFRQASDDGVAFDRLPPKCILDEQVYHERITSKSHEATFKPWTVKQSARGMDILATSKTITGDTLKLKRKHQTQDPPKTKRTILEQALGIA